jgi:hypothetical protein
VRRREFVRSLPRVSLKAAALAAAVGLFAPSGGDTSLAQGAGPFAGMAGNWSGTGAITLASGSHERIRCRAAYNSDGKNLGLRLRCASDTYNFDLSANLSHNGDAISGSWSEATRNVTGTVSGRASGGTIQATVSAAVFSANLTLTTKGTKQSVSIRSQGTEFSEAAITLNRS